MPPVIAIVGRPNVGKSALFNRIARRRIAIVHDQPGVTRDRITVECEWRGKTFTLVDTGGIGLVKGEKAPDVISQAAIDQVQLAIEAAHVILFVVNVQEGLLPLDQEVGHLLRHAGKPVLLAVNKSDNSQLEDAAASFSELGFDQWLPVSAIHDRGMDAMLRSAFDLLPESALAEQSTPTPAAAVPPLKIAVLGRPNVGKSSLINALTQSERVIVSPVPGTTRDSVDVPFEVETDGVRQSYILIDTAGVRQKRRIDNSIEFFSVTRTEESVARCDLAIFILDAEAGVTAQDKKVAGMIVEHKKACVLVVNKWDLVQPALSQAHAEERKKARKKSTPHEHTTLADFAAWIQKQLFFLDYAPVIFTSAKSGFHLERLLESIRYVTDQLRLTIPTSLLNRALHDTIERKQPVSATGQRLKFFYATQTDQAPPSFLLFVNRKELFSPAYTKYLEHELRKAFGFEGCPILLNPRARPKTVETIRRSPKSKGNLRSKGKLDSKRKLKSKLKFPGAGRRRPHKR